MNKTLAAYGGACLIVFLVMGILMGGAPASVVAWLIWAALGLPGFIFGKRLVALIVAILVTYCGVLYHNGSDSALLTMTLMLVYAVPSLCISALGLVFKFILIEL